MWWIFDEISGIFYDLYICNVISCWTIEFCVQQINSKACEVRTIEQTRLENVYSISVFSFQMGLLLYGHPF
jgi:hypothetical protein